MYTSRKKFLSITLFSVSIWFFTLIFLSFYRYRLSLQFDESTTFFTQFSQVWPWYSSWFWLTPIIIIVVRSFIHRKKNWWEFIAKHTCLLLVLFPIYSVSVGLVVFFSMGELAGEAQFIDGLVKMVKTASWPFDLTIYVAVLLASYVSIYLEQLRTKDQENLLLQTQLLKVKLSALESQLNPHFLFNALNTISGLMRMKDTDRATHALAELSYMLRALLGKNSHIVTLKDEIIFVKKYVYFQTLRFEERLSSSIKLSSEAENVDIPFLLLHTLVENAVKHGAQEDGEVNNISISAHVDNKRLLIKMTNSMAKQKRDDGFGIGLLNSQERLSLLYKSDFSLSCDRQQNGSCLTQLNLPIEVDDV